MSLFQWLSKWGWEGGGGRVLVRPIFPPGVSRSKGMYRFNSQPVNRPLDSKTYLGFLSITTWAQNPCREWNQSVSSLSRAVEGKYIVTLDNELNNWDKTMKGKWRGGDDRWETNRTEAAVRNRGETEKLMSRRKRSSYHVCQCRDDFTQCCQRFVNIGSLLKNKQLF